MQEEKRKKIRVTAQANLVVGFGELIPMESGSDNSVEQNTVTVTKKNEELTAKRNRNFWWKE